MTALQTAMQELIAQLESEGKKAKNLAELEQLVISHSQELAKRAFEELSQDLQERISPPGERLPRVRG